MNQSKTPSTAAARSRWLTLPAICALTATLLAGPNLAQATTSWQFGGAKLNAGLTAQNLADIFEDRLSAHDIANGKQPVTPGWMNIPPGKGYDHNSEDQHGFWRTDDRIAHVQMKFDGRIADHLKNIFDQKENWRHGKLDTVVPIPASVWLFGSALGLLGWSSRRKRVTALED
jgi:hypothetical protein